MALTIAAGCSNETDPSPPEPAPVSPSSSTGTGTAGTSQPNTSGQTTTAQPAGSTTASIDDLGTVTQPPFPADTREDTQAAVYDSGLVFTDLRIGRHDGFDRVVWEFAGTGEPGWLARYDDAPARQGSGDPVDLTGDATLLVLIEGVTIAEFLETPDPGITPYPGPATTAAADTEHVTEVIVGAWYEGYQDGFVGVSTKQPFRMYRLADPPRVVLEISD